MIRQVCWVEKLDDGVKREVRVGIERHQVKWQYKRSDEEKWDYTTPASREDWDNFMERMESRYQRRNVSLNDLNLVRLAREKALGKT